MSKDILVVVHNQLDHVRRCLESVREHTRDFTLWLWDNASDPDTARYLVEARGRLTVCGQNLGFIVPNNRLAAKGQGDYLILLNSDTVVLPGWADALVAVLEARPEVGVAGYGGRKLGQGGVGLEAGDDYVEGWCLCLARTTYRGHGLFCEEYQFGCCEDADLCLRLRAAGRRVCVLPDKLVRHVGGASGGAWPGYAENHRLLCRKWGL